MADAASVLKDPNFQGLPIEERRKVLSAVDPNFGGLQSSEQDKVLGISAASADPNKQTFAQRAGKGIKGEAKTDVSAAGNFMAGAGSGLINTLTLGGKLAPEGAPEALAPNTTAGKLGYGAEQAAEYMSPVGGAKAGMSVAKRVGTEALKGGVVAALQSGFNPLAIGGGAAGGAAGAGLEAAAGKALPFVKNRLNPQQQAAADWAESRGVPLSTGQKTGNRATVKLERGLENIPGGSDRATQFFQNQEDKLTQTGKDLVNRTQPGRQMSPYEAGHSLAQANRNVIDEAKQQADELYNQIRQEYAKHNKSVTTGSKPSNILDAQGNPVQIPIQEDFQLPVNVAHAKAQLAPILDELNKTMPEAKRQMSPGYQALRQLIEGPDVMDAVTADRNLSALKSVVRGGNNPFLNSRSQGLAKVAVGSLSGDVETALNAADPSILPMLQRAREAVTKHHVVADMLNSLPDEPAQLYQRMVTAGDRTFDDLAFLNQVAPQQMRQVGRTFLDGLFTKATQEGGFQRAEGVMRDWQALGPATKRLLFGSPEAIHELDNFFLAAKMLTKDPNPSGTAKLVSALGILGAAVDAASSPGTMQDKMARFGVDAGAMAAGSNLLARLLLTPGGTRLLTSTIQSSPISPLFRQSVNGIYKLLQPMVSGDTPQEVQINPDNLPKFAHGGVFGNTPTLGIIGEAGPELRAPLTAAHPTVPEKGETIGEQVSQLTEGKRRLVMLPKGTPALAVHKDHLGNHYLYNPASVSRSQIHAAIVTNKLPKLLGAAHGGMGVPDKSKLKGPVKAVVGKTPKGVTTQATATDSKHLKSALRQTKRVVPHGGSLSLKPAEYEIADRLATPGPV
jgi:hypothetical protein